MKHFSLTRKSITAMIRTNADLAGQFKLAQNAINNKDNVPTKEVGNSTKLNLYGLYKQAEVGQCNASRPGMFDPVGRAKYDAWAALGSMSKEDAMKKYVEVVKDMFDGKLPADTTATSEPVADTSANAPPAAVGVANIPKKLTVADVAFPKQQGGKNVKDIKYNTIAIEQKENGVVNIVLNRPKRGNAFDMQLWDDFDHVFKDVEHDASVRAAILSGSNGNFSTGMDLMVFSDMNASGAKESCDGRRREGILRFVEYLQNATGGPEKCPVPVIGAIAGNCIGGAIDIITACDLRYCTKNANFCVKEIDLAIVADMGTLQRLPRIVGFQRAAELALTGRSFNGEEAKAMGLVLECFDTEEIMMAHVHKVADQIASKSPLTVRGTKQSLLYSREHTVQESLQHVRMWNSAFLQSEDLIEAMSSVMLKRSAEYKKN